VLGIVAVAAVVLPYGCSALSVLAPFANRPVAPVVAAANWISNRYPLDTRVVADWYSYAPPTFKRYTTDFVSNHLDGIYASTDYDLLLLTRGGTGRYFWKNPGSRLMERNWTIDRSYPQTQSVLRSIDRLLAPESAWALVYENADVVVFQRRG
jgi:hypothetical protein